MEEIEKIKMDTMSIAKKYGVAGDLTSDFVDIDRFLDVLYKLLKSNNYILLEGESQADNMNKFEYTEEFPDKENNDMNIVTFEIMRRAPASLASDADPFQGTKHYRPIYLGESTDSVNGGKVIHMMNAYDNRIRFKCFSKSTSHARRLASLFESLLIKYYFIFKRYVPLIITEGRGNGLISNEYGLNRQQGIPIDVFVRTYERFTLREQELKCLVQEIKVS